MCNSCSDLRLQQGIKKRKSRAKLYVPGQAKAPVKGTSVEIIGLDKDLLSIIDKHSQKITTIMKLFWEQQKKISDRPSFGRRCHPMIIKWCLSISSKSASPYERLRETFKNGGLLEHPSKRMLQNFQQKAVSP